MSEGFNRSDIVDFFLVEASEHLQILNDGLLSLEENSEDLSVVDEIFRSAHTIKGSAAMLGFNVVSKLAHKMEDLLGKIRGRELNFSEAVVDLLLQSVDTLTIQVENIPKGQTEDESILLMFDDLYADYLSEGKPKSEKPIPPKAKSQPPKEEPEEDMELPEDLDLDGLADLLPEEEEEVDIPPPPPVEKPKIVKPVAAPVKKAPPERLAESAKPEEAERSLVSASDQKIIKVGVEGLNLLMNLVGELVINRTRLDQRILYVSKISSELNFSQERLLKVIRDFKEKYEFGQVGNNVIARGKPVGTGEYQETQSASELLDGFFDMEFDQYDDFNILSRSLMEIGSDISEIMNELTDFFEQFEEESSQIRRITNDLQEEITNIRMVPVGQLFSRFHRLVRDVSKEENKQVALKLSGEDAKLDKTVINEISDPLMHLVRNSVSHGIELPEVREARGKPAEGTISLNAFKEGDNIIIEILDDGNGIDVQRVRETIAEKGLRSMAEIERMSDDDAIKFIFAPGFSTKKEVSSISGRGVGMDVVKTNISKLGGTIEIKTELGKGTRFSIKLPLTLVIYAALLVKCGDQEFAISLTSVEETARIPLYHIHNIGKQEVIKLRDQVLPIRRLSRILQYPSSMNGTDTGAQQYVPIVIVRSAEHPLALVVDELIGQETIVIKPLGDYLKKVKLFSGATISGEGKVRLILDIPTIVERELLSGLPNAMSATIRLDEDALETPMLPVAEAMPEVLLLVDDSISIRKVIAMMLEKAGYKVDVAVDGVEAMEKLTSKPYTLLITDLEMPRMHGYELIAEVKGNQAMQSLPIVVMTSRAGEKHQNKAIELGADDYIVKPVDEETLLNSIRKLMAERQEVG